LKFYYNSEQIRKYSNLCKEITENKHSRIKWHRQDPEFEDKQRAPDDEHRVARNM